MGKTDKFAKTALMKWLKWCGTSASVIQNALAKMPILHAPVMSKKTVPLSIKIDREVFIQLDDYYRTLRSVGYSKSGLVEEAVKNHLLTLTSLKLQVQSCLRGIKSR